MVTYSESLTWVSYTFRLVNVRQVSGERNTYMKKRNIHIHIYTHTIKNKITRVKECFPLLLGRVERLSFFKNNDEFVIRVLGKEKVELLRNKVTCVLEIV